MKYNEIKEKLGYLPNEEQKSVLEEKKRHQVVYAYPGAGKTATILQIAIMNPDKKVEILSFNRDIAQEIQEKIKQLGLKNAQSSTTNALAYKYNALNNFGKEKETWNARILIKKGYNKKEAKDIYKIYNNYLKSSIKMPKEYLKRKEKKYFEEISETKILRKIEENYKEGINKEKINKLLNINIKTPDLAGKLREYQMFKKELYEEKEKIKKQGFYKKEKDKIKKEKIEKLEKEIIKIFKSMNSKKENSIPQSHDHYMKAFAISSRKLDAEIVCLDEGHDTSEVTKEIIVEKFPNAQRIVLGDKNQAIYGWRGAVNALDSFAKMDNTVTKALSHSYRFGEKIAEKANQILRKTDNFLKGKKIKGMNKEENINEEFPKNEKVLVIGRTNIGTIKYGIEKMLQEENVYFGKKLNKYLFNSIKNLKQFNKTKVTDFRIKKYKEYEDIKIAIKEELETNNEIKLIINLIEKMGTTRTEEIINKIENSNNREEARYICITAHKSKGLEFNNVVILDDFEEWENLVEKRNEIIKELGYRNDKHIQETLKKELKEIQEEINLIYVAITRAKKRLKEKNKATFSF